MLPGEHIEFFKASFWLRKTNTSLILRLLENLSLNLRLNDLLLTLQESLQHFYSHVTLIGYIELSDILLFQLIFKLCSNAILFYLDLYSILVNFCSTLDF